MMTASHISIEFVSLVPEDLEPMTLYISMEYASTTHLCFCGCGSKVVLPLSPTDWQLYFDGHSLSLTPSVGSWDLPCRSHYWIKGSKVRWASSWTQDQIDRAAGMDLEAKTRYFSEQAGAERSTPAGPVAKDRRPWRRLLRWFRR